MYYGTRIPGALKPVAVDATATKPLEVFEIELETEGIPDEAAAIQQLLTLEETPDLKILYIETDQISNKITLQFMDTGPGQISFGGLFSAIPAIAILVGIVIVGIILWQLYNSNLSWLLIPLIIVGGVATLGLIFAPQLSQLRPAQIRTESRVSNDRLQERINGERNALNQERQTIKNTLTDIRDSEESLSKEKNQLLAEKERNPVAAGEIQKQIENIDGTISQYRRTRETYQRRLDEIGKQQEALGKVMQS